MSNVLIGIIGVILFIGLALAGALFLGSRFQEATINSKASAIVQAMSQTANAANLYRLQEGVSSGSDEAGKDELVARGYLKVRPALVADVNRMIPLNANGSAVGTPGFIIAELQGGNAQKICDAIERQSGGVPDPTSISWHDKVKGQQGCYRNSGTYMAYVRI